MLLEQIHTNRLSPETYQPSEIERDVLAIVVISDSPSLAIDLIDSDSQRYTAMQKLIQYGLLKNNGNGVSLTDSGYITAKQQALVDDNLQPTTNATKIASNITQ